MRYLSANGGRESRTVNINVILVRQILSPILIRGCHAPDSYLSPVSLSLFLSISEIARHVCSTFSTPALASLSPENHHRWPTWASCNFDSGKGVTGRETLCLSHAILSFIIYRKKKGRGKHRDRNGKYAEGERKKKERSQAREMRNRCTWLSRADAVRIALKISCLMSRRSNSFFLFTGYDASNYLNHA